MECKGFGTPFPPPPRLRELREISPLSLVLTITEGSEPARLALTGTTIRIGRSDECHVRLRDRRCSREHCVLEPMESGYRLIDAGSRNGTRVNGTFVSQARLRLGDRIEIGSATIVLESASAKPAGVTAIPRSARAAGNRNRTKGPARIAVLAASILILIAGATLLYSVSGPGPETEIETDLRVATRAEMESTPSESADSMLLPPRGIDPPRNATEPFAPLDSNPDEEIFGEEPFRHPERLRVEIEAETEIVQSGASRVDLYLALQEIDELASAHDYDSALAMLETTLEQSDFPDITEEFEGRLADLLSMQSMFRRLVASLSERTAVLSGGLKITSADDKEIHFDGGITTSWSKISPEDFVIVCESVLTSPEDRIALSIFCFDTKGQEDRAHRVLEQVAMADSGMKEKVDRTLERKLGVSIPPEGFVLWEHRWVTPRKFDRLRAASRTLEWKTELVDGDEIRRRAAYHSLARLGVTGKEVLEEELPRCRWRIHEELRSSPVYTSIMTIKKERERLDRMRERILALVFDLERYPELFRQPEASQEAARSYRETQAEIDEQTRKLAEAWKAGENKVVRIPESFRNSLRQLREILGWFADQHVPVPESNGSEFLELLPAGVARLNVHNVPLTERDVTWWEESQKALAFNDGYHGVATPPEIELVSVTNRYRMLLGRRALYIHESLAQAARGHSTEMTRLGYFAHESPTRGRKNPEDRVALNGYDGKAVGENIARGRVGPEETHVMWLHSPPHHRNILSDAWNEIGTGNNGSHWTSNFGQRSRSSPIEAQVR